MRSGGTSGPTRSRRRVAAEDVAAVVAAGSRFLFAWVDLLSDHATTAYLDEARRLARQASVAQAAFVRDVLTSDPDDLAAASRRLGYDLGALHLAVVLKVPPGQEMTEVLLEQTARALADASGTGRRLAVPIDSRTGWIWITVDAEADTSPDGEQEGRGGRRPAGPRPGRLPHQPPRGARGLSDRRAHRAPAGQRDRLRRRRAGRTLHPRHRSLPTVRADHPRSAGGRRRPESPAARDVAGVLP